MSCPPFDLKDYVFGELPVQDARTLEVHVAGCSGCGEEIQRLRLTHTALLGVREEEIPRRIAFVSDKVFEPSWWQRFWGSGPRLAFASAAMLSLAILTHGITRPAPEGPAPVDTAIIEARVQAELTKRLDNAIEQAVARVEQRQGEKLAQVVAATEKRLELERRADLVTIAQNYEVLEKKLMRIERESYNIASNGAGQ